MKYIFLTAVIKSLFGATVLEILALGKEDVTGLENSGTIEFLDKISLSVPPEN